MDQQYSFRTLTIFLEKVEPFSTLNDPKAFIRPYILETASLTPAPVEIVKSSKQEEPQSKAPAKSTGGGKGVPSWFSKGKK